MIRPRNAASNKHFFRVHIKTLVRNRLYNLEQMEAMSKADAPTRKFLALPKSVQEVLKLVGIPLICLTPLVVATLYILGGMEILKFALSQLTWKLALKIVGGIAGLVLVTWARHELWFGDEPAPMWWRRSIWLNILEILILVGLIVLGIWAIPKFA